MFDLSSAPSYGIHRHLDGAIYADVVARTKAALATEGFGVLTEIDIRATMKAKLDYDTAPYVILGACNPGLAREALSVEAAVGLLLPCNVVVAETPTGVAVAAVDPVAMFEVVGRAEVQPMARAVRDKLLRAIAAL